MLTAIWNLNHKQNNSNSSRFFFTIVCLCFTWEGHTISTTISLISDLFDCFICLWLLSNKNLFCVFVCVYICVCFFFSFCPAKHNNFETKEDSTNLSMHLVFSVFVFVPIFTVLIAPDWERCHYSLPREWCWTNEKRKQNIAIRYVFNSFYSFVRQVLAKTI